MWRPRFTNAFLKAFRTLDSRRKGQAKEAVKAFLHYLETQQKTSGLGLKRMSGGVWEVRMNIHDRILFESDRQHHTVEFLFVGNHDDVKRFLRGR